MAGLIQGLEIARRSLLAYQAALNVAGNNAANVAVKGYTRQNPLLVTTPDERTPEGYLGTGVDMAGVTRARDTFLDIQVRQEMSLSGRWQARADMLERVEGLVNEPSDQGLSQLLDQFWNAWLDLSNQPEDPAAKSMVVARGEGLVQGLHDLASQTIALSESADSDLQARVTQVNGRLEEVAKLNVQLTKAEAGGKQEPALRDRRDLILDELANDVGATYVARADGSVAVRVGDRKVVDGEVVQGLAVLQTRRGDRLESRLVYASDSTAPTALGGELGGILEVRDQVLPAFLGQLDQLASTLADSVNRIHVAGPSRLPFFRGNTATNIEVVPELSADSSQVNAGSTGDPGDNDIALAVAALRDARLLNRGTATISTFYQTQVTNLGSLAEQANNGSENQKAAVESIEAQRQSVVGVNLEDELTRMTTLQRAYEAAARVLTVIDSACEALLNI
jgi:flagellar hook-associated protein 1 FlgK